MSGPAVIGYDSVAGVDTIPLNAQAVMGYVDPPPDINTWAQLLARFPTTPKVSITASGVPGAMMGDSEKGNMSPAGLAQWDVDELAAGRTPANYCSLSAVDDVVAALGALKTDPTKCGWFPADWTGVPHLADLGPLPVVGTQYANPAQSGGDYDLSVIVLSWLTPAPAPPPEGTADVNPVIWSGQFHEFEAVPSGQLAHRWYTTPPTPPEPGFGWNVEALGAGIIPGQSIRVGQWVDQLHAFATRADGSTLHVWNDLGSVTWGSEILPPVA